MTDSVAEPGANAAPARAQTLGADGSVVDWPKIFLGFGGMVAGQFMAMLDIQIVASSLSQIQAGIGASADEIGWVQTIYLLTEVLIMPLTAYLTKLYGTRRFYVVATIVFILASIATGLSTTTEMMIVTRAVQGLAAGAMIPPVFATAMSVFPPERRMTANIGMGVIITLAPTLGPTLGGHLTEALGWRWLFFINVPIGVIVVFLVGRYGGFDKPDPSLAKGLDWWGVGLMSVFLLSMQYVFEEGAGHAWFQNGTILWLTVLSVITGVSFIWRQLTYYRPIVSLKPFTDRNFALGSVMSLISGLSLFGGTFIIPLFLGNVLRYNSAEVGNTMLVSGLVMLGCMPITSRIANLINPRVALVLGFGVSAWGVALGAHISQNWGFWDFAALQAVRAIGQMLTMIGSQQLVMSTLPISMMKDASAIVSLIRNVGGAIGVAMLTTVIGHQAAVHYTELAAGVNAGNATSVGMLAGLTDMMSASGAADPASAAQKAFSMLIRREALVLSYADAFYVLALSCLVAGALAVFARPSPTNAPPPASAGH